MEKKVFVAMSGGVDSSVCAAVLKEQGYDISGITLRLFDSEALLDCEKSCGSLSDVSDAKKVADKMGIQHIVYDFYFGSDDFAHKYIAPLWGNFPYFLKKLKMLPLPPG